MDYGLPILYALFVWWFSTGAIIYLDGLPPRTFKWTMLGASALALAALFGLSASADDTSVFGAYVAFTCGVLVWGWNETAFLMGYLTGPRRVPCAAHCRGWRHFWHAIQTILHHELAIIASAALVVALTYGAPNQVGTVTFLVLWLMRLSTKLNVFLGVPNLTEEFLPAHLAYLKAFFTKRPMNMLFPFTVTGATLITAWLVHEAVAADAGSFEVAAYTFLSTMMALAVLEHWFLVLPLPVEALWRWGLKTHAAPAPEPAAELRARADRPPPPELDERSGPDALASLSLATARLVPAPPVPAPSTQRS